jgi:hypothetical protein
VPAVEQYLVPREIQPQLGVTGGVHVCLCAHIIPRRYLGGRERVGLVRKLGAIDEMHLESDAVFSLNAKRKLPKLTALARYPAR